MRRPPRAATVQVPRWRSAFASEGGYSPRRAYLPSRQFLFLSEDVPRAFTNGELKQFPAYLNRWDSQQARNEGVFWH